MPVGGLRMGPPRLSWAPGPRLGHNLVLGPAQAKTQCNCQKTQQPGQFWPAQAVRGFGAPVGDFRGAHTWPGWAAKPWPRTKGYLKAARGIL